MQIYDIIKRYRYIIITNKSHIKPVFELLATDKNIRWSSGCDIYGHNNEMEYVFENHPTAYIELVLLKYSSWDIRLSYSEFWHTDYKTTYRQQEYITSQDLLTASKKSIIILNKN